MSSPAEPRRLRGADRTLQRALAVLPIAWALGRGAFPFVVPTFGDVLSPRGGGGPLRRA